MTTRHILEVVGQSWQIYGPDGRRCDPADAETCTRVQSAAIAFMSHTQPKPPTIANLARAAIALLLGLRRVPVDLPGVTPAPRIGWFYCDVDEDGNLEIGRRLTADEAADKLGRI